MQRLPSGQIVRDAYDGNVIPASRINPTSSAIIGLSPQPQRPGAPNYTVVRSSPLDIDTSLARIDYLLSSNDNLFGHIILSDGGTDLGPVLGPTLDGGGSFQGTHQNKYALGWTHTFSPTDLNDFRIGYVRNLRDTRHLPQSEDLNAKFGIPTPALDGDLFGLSTMNLSGFASMGAFVGFWLQPIDKYSLADSYTMIRGSHNLKFGFDGLLKTFRNIRSCIFCRGVLNFSGVFTRQPGFSGTGSSAADFMTGTVNSALLANVYREKDGGYDLDWFVQDRWSATSRLTITAGLRYQLHQPHWEARDNLVNMLFEPGFTNPEMIVNEGMAAEPFELLRTQIPGVPLRRTSEYGRSLVKLSKGNFAPRLGIAYRVASKTTMRLGYGIFYGFPDATSSGVLSISAPNLVIISQGSNQVDPTLLIDQPPFGDDPFNRKLTNPSFLATMDPNMRPEFIQNYNLIIQHEFAPGWLAELGYMGSRTTRLLTRANVNDATPALPTDTSSPQSRRRASTELGNITYFAGQGHANYNAFFANVEKQFFEGFSMLANYTWSRALGVEGSFYLAVNQSSFVNPFDLARDYGPLGFDVKHRANISYVYELPFGKGKRFLGKRAGSVVNHLVGGWQLAGITTLQGGLPLTPVLGSSLGKTFSNSRPNSVGDPAASSRQPHDWLNRDAFAVPTDQEIAAGNFFGNGGTGTARAPGLVNIDFAVMKNVTISERVRAQIRAESYNFTNTPSFGRPGSVSTNFNAGSFGKVTSAGDPRVIQVGMKLIF